MMASLVSCGGGDADTANTTTNETPKQEETTQIKGTKIETDVFELTMLDGWKKMDIADGIQVYKGSEALQIGLEGSNVSESYAKTFIEQAVSSYDGEPMEEVSMWGEKFFMTRYESHGSHQTHYATMYSNEGRMLVVKANTKTRELTNDVKSMMDSVVLK